MQQRKIKADAGTFVGRMETLAKLTSRGEASIKDGVALLQEMRSAKVRSVFCADVHTETHTCMYVCMYVFTLVVYGTYHDGTAGL